MLNKNTLEPGQPFYYILNGIQEWKKCDYEIAKFYWNPGCGDLFDDRKMFFTFEEAFSKVKFLQSVH